MLSYSGKILSQFFSQSYGTILPLCYQLEAVHPRAVLAFTYVQLNLHVLDIVLDIGKSVQNLSKIVQNLPLIVQLPNTAYNSICNCPILLKIELQVVSDLLNNFF